MWIARNKDKSLTIFKHKPERSEYHGWWWYNEELLTIDEPLFPELTWEDEPIECSVQLNKRLVVCPKCGKRIWFNNTWDWIECPECKEKICI